MSRPTKYKKKYCKQIIEFFSVPSHDKFLKKEIIKANGTVEREYQMVAAKLPTLNKFARHIGVSHDSLLRWSSEVYPDDYAVKSLRGQLRYPEFCVAYKEAKRLQHDFLVDNGLAGLTPPASFIFVATNITEMSNKQNVDHTSKGEKLAVTVVSYKDQVNE